MSIASQTSDIGPRNLAVFIVALGIIVLDQVSKSLVRMFVPLGQSVLEDWPVRFSHYSNNGAAFSMFQNQTYLFVIVAAVAISVIVFYSRRLPKEANVVRLGLGLQLGGAIGNLIDRLLRGGVTDFIDVGFWPVFNVADSAIVVGVGLLAYYLLFATPSQPAKAEEPSAPLEQ